MPRERPAKTLELLPIANLATLLVPVGLMLTQFVALQVMQPTVEPPFPAESRMDVLARPIVPTVLVGESGFRVLGAEEVLAGPDGRPVLGCSVTPCTLDTYDYKGLQRLLGHVKAAYPWADTLILERRSDVPYSVLVRTFETVQTDEGEDLFPRVQLR